MIYFNSDLKKLQRTQLFILLELKRICDKHDIHYFLTGGTLLGAVRHQGFIPWDDDIDVAMLRDEYTKFISVCQDELSSAFFLQTKESDEFCSLSFAKLQLNGTKRVDESVKNTHARTGIDIDIFPYDDIPADFRGKIQYDLCMMFRGIYGIQCGYNVLNREKSLKKKVGMIICHFVAIFLSKKRVSQMMDSILQKYNSQGCEYALDLAGASYGYEHERIRKDIIENYSMLPFEGFLFPVPHDYDTFLHTLYGDYMTLPPKEKQIQHAIDELDFGKWDNIDIVFSEVEKE